MAQKKKIKKARWEEEKEHRRSFASSHFDMTSFGAGHRPVSSYVHCCNIRVPLVTFHVFGASFDIWRLLQRPDKAELQIHTYWHLLKEHTLQSLLHGSTLCARVQSSDLLKQSC